MSCKADATAGRGHEARGHLVGMDILKCFRLFGASSARAKRLPPMAGARTRLARGGGPPARRRQGAAAADGSSDARSWPGTHPMTAGWYLGSWEEYGSTAARELCPMKDDPAPYGSGAGSRGGERKEESESVAIAIRPLFRGLLRTPHSHGAASASTANRTCHGCGGGGRLQVRAR